MPAFYVDGYAYNSKFTKEFDDRYHNPQAYGDSMGLAANTSIIAGRVHGNPFFESGTVGLQESSARMREQDKIYRAAVTSGDSSLDFQEIFGSTPSVWRYNNGFHVIDIDDPTLVEHGEEFVHRNFTDYLSENVCSPKDEWDKLMSSYLLKIDILNLEAGFVPPTVAVEPLRQLLGLPYEWFGAPID